MKKFLTYAIFAGFAASLSAQNPPTVKLEPAQNAPQIAAPANAAPSGAMPANFQNAPSKEELEKARIAKIAERKKALEPLFGEIRPPTDEIRPSLWEGKHIWIICAAVAAAALAALLFRRKKPKPRTPYETAKLRFETVAAIAEKINAKNFAEEVSQTVRNYIDGVYNIPAPERTTEEFLDIAKNSEHFDSAAKEALGEILKLADKAKFAMHAFDASEKARLLDASRSFVEADNIKNSQKPDTKK